MRQLSKYINTYMDFPKPGIAFRDIMPVLFHPEAFALCMKELKAAAADFEFDMLAGFEARGFLFGTPLAYVLKKPFIPLRKAGKLPGNVASQGYMLEYGEATLEMQLNLIKPGDRVLLFDDLLATGGTASAGCQLIEKAGGQVAGCLAVVELTSLKGREKFADYPVKSLIQFP